MPIANIQRAGVAIPRLGVRAEIQLLAGLETAAELVAQNYVLECVRVVVDDHGVVSTCTSAAWTMEKVDVDIGGIEKASED